MGQRPAELTPEASPWHRWGAELRQYRTARGMSLQQLGDRLHFSRGYVAKWERGVQQPDRHTAAAADEVLDMAGALLRAYDEAAAAAARSARLDGRAARNVSNRVIDVSNPGEYVSNPVDELGGGGWSGPGSGDERVSVPCRLRDGRVDFVTVPRRLLLRGGLGMAAAALTGPAGTPGGVERLQRRARALSAYGSTPVEYLQRLRQVLIDTDNVLGPRQVLPTVHEQLAVIQILRRDSSGADLRALLESATHFAEFAAWLHQDLREFSAAQFWLDRALQWSHTLGDPELTTYVLARKSQLAGEMHDEVDVVDLAEAAIAMARPSSRLAAVSATYAGVGHGLRQEPAAAERAFSTAFEVLDDSPADPSPWAVWLDGSYIQAHRAQALNALGRHSEAADALAAALTQLPDRYHRDRGVYLGRQAVAHAAAGQPERAAAAGLQALAVAEDTGSARIFGELAHLDTALRPWAALPAVVDLRTSLDSVILHETEIPT